MPSGNSSNATIRPARFPRPGLAVLALAALAGAGLFAFGASPENVGPAFGGVIALAALLLWPELALALYVVIGDVKGDERVASLLPYDLTLALAAILVTGLILNMLRGKHRVPMPAVYFLFIPLICMMTASLAYTPVFDAGLEKLGRFLAITSIAIVAPFFALGTPGAMKRFLWGFAVVAFAICAWSLHALGGSDRLATPSDNTIGLGHIACALILLIWFAVIPRLGLPWRLLTYGLLAIPALALVGSGSRGPAIACGMVIFISLFFYRRRWLDIVILLALGAAALPFARIPGSSIDYLGTLIGSQSVTALMSFRGDLLDNGWSVLQRHPLIGIGIQGFRYGSPNPALYNWPHNIFLEIACEMGIPAALLACAIFASALRESVRQLKNHLDPEFLLAQLAAALLLVGVINGTNTGDINSDRSTWLFLSLVFVVRGFQSRNRDFRATYLEAPHAIAA